MNVNVDYVINQTQNYESPRERENREYIERFREGWEILRSEILKEIRKKCWKDRNKLEKTWESIPFNRKEVHSTRGERRKVGDRAREKEWYRGDGEAGFWIEMYWVHGEKRKRYIQKVYHKFRAFNHINPQHEKKKKNIIYRRTSRHYESYLWCTYLLYCMMVKL